MDITSLRWETVCFTGHRPEKLTQSEEQIREALRHGIQKALAWRYTTFISGMAQGVDIWAAEEILSLKKKHPEIQLVCAIPYEGYAHKWDDEWKNKFEAVMSAAEEVRYICPRNMRGAPIIRDKWMVDHSSLVIAVYNGEKGGTQTTVAYAEKKKTRVINVLRETDIL